MAEPCAANGLDRTDGVDAAGGVTFRTLAWMATPDDDQQGRV
jgi:hypothetical protein